MDLTQDETMVLAQLGVDGALFATHLRQLLEGDYWRRLVKLGLLQQATSDVGLVLGLTERGRREVVAQDLLEGGTPPYLNSPTSLINRAYLMLVWQHLEAAGYEGVSVYYKRGSGLTKNQNTAQVLSLVVRPAGYQPPPLDPSEDERRAYPLVYAPLGQGPATGATFRTLYYRHRQQVYRWQSPVLLAVPAWTPDLRRQQELLQERANKQEVVRVLVVHPD